MQFTDSLLDMSECVQYSVKAANDDGAVQTILTTPYVSIASHDGGGAACMLHLIITHTSNKQSQYIK